MRELRSGEAISVLLDMGWKIENVPSKCGGQWVWMKPDGNQYENIGCLCHHTIYVYHCVDGYCTAIQTMKENKDGRKQT